VVQAVILLSQALAVGVVLQAQAVGAAGQVRREPQAERLSTPKILRVIQLGLSFTV
jgi:hypothetical protein